MFKSNWEISTFIKFSKSSGFAVSNACCKCSWWSIYLKKNSILINRRFQLNTLAFFKSDLTVKPSVSKLPVARNRALVSRRGEVAMDIRCCRLVESVSISHKWHILSVYCLLTTTIRNFYCQETLLSSFDSQTRHLLPHSKEKNFIY